MLQKKKKKKRCILGCPSRGGEGGVVDSAVFQKVLKRYGMFPLPQPRNGAAPWELLLWFVKN